MENKNTAGLDLLRKPFEAHHISKLPKPTKKQTDDLKVNSSLGIRCKLCGGWHHKDVVHLDYVGHAALTDRLLDCDSNWSWEPMSLNPDGSPKLDSNGGLWIKLTVCGVTRIGYGHPDGKDGGNAIKETIGDALRNAAMRFGAALDLWHKGDLHGDDPDEKPKTPAAADPKPKAADIPFTAKLLEGPPQASTNKLFIENKADYGETRLIFGKYKNKTFKEIGGNDLMQYIRWCIKDNNTKNPDKKMSPEFQALVQLTEQFSNLKV